ncbi:MAG: PDZ domain-containing protein [Acidimicrobiales bacterium]
MTTTNQIVPEKTGGFWTTTPARKRNWVLPLLVTILIALSVGYVVANHYTQKLFAITPGTAQTVQPFISVPKDKLHTDSGKILLVTVFQESINPFTWIGDKLDHNVEILHVEQLTGNTPASQLNAEDQVQMETSTQTAVVVALRRLGYQVNLNGMGAEVDAVVTGTPAAGVLSAGDVITSFDGTPIQSDDQLVTAILMHHPGDTVTLQVREGTPAKVVTKMMVLASAPANSATPTTHAILGIQASTDEMPDLPINVSIDPGNIGGPSAGLAFTLGIIDDLTSGTLTGGKVIAVTGAINPDGTVGDVGGVAQKAVAVTRAGAVAFIVPNVEVKTAEAHVGTRVKVIGVANLEQALQAMGSLGGNISALPPAPATLSG